jgi:hypothetical protein
MIEVLKLDALTYPKSTSGASTSPLLAAWKKSFDSSLTQTRDALTGVINADKTSLTKV